MAHINELNDFTTSAFIHHPTEPRLLLIKHLKLGVWLQPGGHIELDENPLQALHRELREETGLSPNDYEIIQTTDRPDPEGNINILPLPFHLSQHDYNSTHKHIDLTYLLKSKTAIVTDNPDGAEAIEWLTIEEIRKLAKQKQMYPETLHLCEWVLEHDRLNEVKSPK